MHKILYPKRKIDFVIYPGTSAHSLDTLISFNISWDSTFKVLLDSDKEGKIAQKKYIEQFELMEDTILVLPIDNKKIEDYFSEEEKKALYVLCFEIEKTSRINKKEFSGIFSLLNLNKTKLKLAKKELEDNTILRFKELFEKLLM